MVQLVPTRLLGCIPMEPARLLSFGRRLPHFRDWTHSAIRHWGAGPTRPQRGHGPSKGCPGQAERIRIQRVVSKNVSGQTIVDEHVITHPFGKRGPSTMFPVMYPAFHRFLYSHRCLLGLLIPPPSLFKISKSLNGGSIEEAKALSFLYFADRLSWWSDRLVYQGCKTVLFLSVWRIDSVHSVID